MAGPFYSGQPGPQAVDTLNDLFFAVGTSNTQHNMTAGQKTFVTQTGRSLVAGMPVVIQASLSAKMYGLINSYSSSTGALTVTIKYALAGAVGIYSAWTIHAAGVAATAQAYVAQGTIQAASNGAPAGTEGFLPYQGDQQTGNVVTGDLLFSGSSQRILADWNPVSGPRFQGTVGNASVGVMPSQYGNRSAWTVYGSVAASDYSLANFAIDMAEQAVNFESIGVGAGAALLPFRWKFNSAEVMRLNSLGRLILGSSVDDGLGLAQINGHLSFAGAGRRIYGDFSNARHLSRTLFMAAATDGVTRVGALPNGLATSAAFNAYGLSDPTNSPLAQLICDTSNGFVGLLATRSGTGAYLPFTIQTGGSERLRVSPTTGYVGIGLTSPLDALSVGNGTDAVGVGVSGFNSYLRLGGYTSAGNNSGQFIFNSTSGNFYLATGTRDAQFARYGWLGQEFQIYANANSGVITHAFRYNEGGAEMVLYRSDGQGTLLLDVANSQERLFGFSSGGFLCGALHASAAVNVYSGGSPTLNMSADGRVDVARNAAGYNWFSLGSRYLRRNATSNQFEMVNQANNAVTHYFGDAGGIRSIGAEGIGYGTGSGGTVTQATSKGTAVTLNKVTGQITLSNSSLAAGATVEFQVNNNLVANTDVVVVNLVNGFGSPVLYALDVREVQTGGFVVRLKNTSVSSASEALIVTFAIIKGSAT